VGVPQEVPTWERRCTKKKGKVSRGVPVLSGRPEGHSGENQDYGPKGARERSVLKRIASREAQKPTGHWDLDLKRKALES